MASDNLKLKISEFETDIWNHSEDSFQTKFDERSPLTLPEFEFLNQVADCVNNCRDDAALSDSILKIVKQTPEGLLLLLQISGLTRSKIISDLKALTISRGASVKFPSSYKTLINNGDAWIIAGPYLAKKIRRVLGGLRKEFRKEALEAINQATWPGFVRQERAKRSGHEGENRLAILLSQCGIPFLPEEKCDNPLCRDIQIFGISFDLIIPGLQDVKVCVKATVHTSNIGQFGESKDHLEIDEARRMIDEKFPSAKRPILLALIDGVGFMSNRAGLEGVLSKSDEFCQFKTLWKAVVICASALEQKIRLALPKESVKTHRAFLEKYNYLDNVIELDGKTDLSNSVAAGDGYFLKIPKKGSR